MARSTSEMAVCCSMRSVTRSCGSEPVLISVDTLVHAEQFLGLDGEGSITAPAAVRDSSHGCPNRTCGQTSNVCWAKRRLFLAFRPPKLSRRGAEHMTEMTRQMTLVKKTHEGRNF